MALGPQPARTDRPRTAALRVLRVLAGADGPLTIAELTEALGGHPNTVRAQLDHLVADGYAGSSPQPTPGRGRPAQGFIATLADVWLAGNLARRLPPEACFVTASLQVDYLGAVAAGDWLESEVDWVRVGGQLCHAAGRIRAGDGRLVTAMRGSFVRLDA